MNVADGEYAVMKLTFKGFKLAGQVVNGDEAMMWVSTCGNNDDEKQPPRS